MQRRPKSDKIQARIPHPQTKEDRRLSQSTSEGLKLVAALHRVVLMGSTFRRSFGPRSGSSLGSWSFVLSRADVRTLPLLVKPACDARRELTKLNIHLRYKGWQQRRGHRRPHHVRIDARSGSQLTNAPWSCFSGLDGTSELRTRERKCPSVIP